MTEEEINRVIHEWFDVEIIPMLKDFMKSVLMKKWDLMKKLRDNKNEHKIEGQGD